MGTRPSSRKDNINPLENSGVNEAKFQEAIEIAKKVISPEREDSEPISWKASDKTKFCEALAESRARIKDVWDVLGVEEDKFYKDWDVGNMEVRGHASYQSDPIHKFKRFEEIIAVAERIVNKPENILNLDAPEFEDKVHIVSNTAGYLSTFGKTKEDLARALEVEPEQMDLDFKEAYKILRYEEIKTSIDTTLFGDGGIWFSMEGVQYNADMVGVNFEELVRDEFDMTILELDSATELAIKEKSFLVAKQRADGIFAGKVGRNYSFDDVKILVERSGKTLEGFAKEAYGLSLDKFNDKIKEASDLIALKQAANDAGWLVGGKTSHKDEQTDGGRENVKHNVVRGLLQDRYELEDLCKALEMSEKEFLEGWKLGEMNYSNSAYGKFRVDVINTDVNDTSLLTELLRPNKTTQDPLEAYLKSREEKENSEVKEKQKSEDATKSSLNSQQKTAGIEESLAKYEAAKEAGEIEGAAGNDSLGQSQGESGKGLGV